MSDNPYYDDLETRDPDAREAALFASLPGQIAHAKAKAPYFAEIFADVDPDSVTGREALAAGVYVVRLEAAGTVVTRQVIVVR